MSYLVIRPIQYFGRRWWLLRVYDRERLVPGSDQCK